jgi:3-isopropylmalate/(R)-2-methylmalate dehydratase large subunit
VSAKDLALHIIGKIGFNGGTGYVFEFRGSTIAALNMEQRMTLCNMSIEAGARAGLIAPDQTTFDYLQGRSKAPQGNAWESAVMQWRQLPSDAGAAYDKQIFIDAADVPVTLSYGTNPGMVMAIDASIPEAADSQEQKALNYMQLHAGHALAGTKVDVVFIGSCTNSRLSDLRAAAEVVQGRSVAKHVRMLVVPGSVAVQKAAEAEGLDYIFTQAGAQWREPGCSMCIAMNGDKAQPGELVVSTSNRNFEGRQGQGVRTILASPAVAAACALAGVIANPKNYLNAEEQAA